MEGYTCPKPEWSGEGYCIFHNPNPDKDHEMFREQLKLQLQQCFIGFIFPRRFTFPSIDFHDADFAFSRFCGTADFQNMTFSGKTNFQYATFHEGANFRGSRFKADVDFIGSEFTGTAWFNDTILDACIGFISTHFKGEVWFAGISNAIADMTGAIFEKEVHFHNTTFSASSFIETQFMGITTFGYFKHMGNRSDIDAASKAPKIVFFEGVDMKHLLFREADLTRASFSQCYNLDQASFYDCKWNTESGRSHVLYDELELRGKVEPWEKMAEREIKRRKGKNQINADSNNGVEIQPAQPLLDVKHSAVEETCRAFKKHFEDRRNFLVAGDFHEGEMEMRRLAKGTWGRRFFSIEAIYWLLSQYGQRWLRPLVCFIVLNLIAATLYSLTGLQLEGDSLVIRWGSNLESSLLFWADSIYIYLQALLYSVSVSALLRGIGATPNHIFGLFVQTVQFVLGPLLIFLIGLAIRRRLRR
ncbi:MAG: pentapeptide repeat-containing protein [Chloroflexota bacterium]|nr:pentapeptide repeat-containing protein [Chloroflexota bacterium]MDE2930399.1 pentapeptide repeat-containing protein [Chloroflexota bacterium]